MAPAASILSSSAAAGSSKRPADPDAEQLDSAALPQGGNEAAARESQQQPTQKRQQLECPRCRSTNTKFCYYNNYSTAQPRHFCRACRRYWTHGGTLRDVPVGGASRRGGSGAGGKRRRVSSAEPSTSPPPQTTSARAEDVFPDLFPFLSDGSFLPPQLDFDLAVTPPAPFSLPSAAVPNFYYGTLAPWDDGTLGDGGVTGAWGGGEIAGPELSWPPAPGN